MTTTETTWRSQLLGWAIANGYQWDLPLDMLETRNIRTCLMNMIPRFAIVMEGTPPVPEVLARGRKLLDFRVGPSLATVDSLKRYCRTQNIQQLLVFLRNSVFKRDDNLPERVRKTYRSRDDSAPYTQMMDNYVNSLRAAPHEQFKASHIVGGFFVDVHKGIIHSESTPEVTALRRAYEKSLTDDAYAWTGTNQDILQRNVMVFVPSAMFAIRISVNCVIPADAWTAADQQTALGFDKKAHPWTRSFHTFAAMDDETRNLHVGHLADQLKGTNGVQLTIPNEYATFVRFLEPPPPPPSVGYDADDDPALQDRVRYISDRDRDIARRAADHHRVGPGTGLTLNARFSGRLEPRPEFLTRIVVSVPNEVTRYTPSPALAGRTAQGNLLMAARSRYVPPVDTGTQYSPDDSESYEPPARRRRLDGDVDIPELLQTLLQALREHTDEEARETMPPENLEPEPPLQLVTPMAPVVAPPSSEPQSDLDIILNDDDALEDTVDDEPPPAPTPLSYAAALRLEATIATIFYVPGLSLVNEHVTRHIFQQMEQVIDSDVDHYRWHPMPPHNTPWPWMFKCSPEQQQVLFGTRPNHDRTMQDQRTGSLCYGALYDYFARRADFTPGWSLPFPDELKETERALKGMSLLRPDTYFNTALVNVYDTGDIITPHTDSSDFGDEIVAVSFKSEQTICFALRTPRTIGPGKWETNDPRNPVTSIRLPPNSALIMTGPSRTHYKHWVPPTEAPRISLTLRQAREP